MVGIHTDIKPQNILVFGNDQQSPYDLTFKISDFGVSSIKSSVGINRSVVRADAYSELTCALPTDIRCLCSIAAPEYSSTRTDRGREQLYDIWSLGCIYMESIVWLIMGRDGL